MTSRFRTTLVALIAGSAILATLPASAQDAERIRITGFSLADADGDQAVNFTIKTENAKPIPADAISLKIQDNVVRVTFTDVPLAPPVGLHVPFVVEGVRHVTKGYALKENNTQSFARLKFDTKAKHAFAGWTIEPTSEGSVIRLPFGDVKTVAPAVVATAEVPAAPGAEAPAPEAAPITAPDAAPEVAPEVAAAPAPEAPAEADAEPKAAPEAGMFGWAQKDAAPAPKTQDADATPIKLADAERGPSMTRVAGGLVVTVLLILALAFCVKKMRGFKGMANGWRPPADSVKVLSTYKVNRNHNVLILDVLGEHLVVGQGPGGMNLLYKLPEGRLAQLHNAQAARPDNRSVLQGLLGKLQSEPSFDEGEFEANEGTLADLARSLESDSNIPLRPTTGQNVRIIRPDQSVTTSSDAEPKDFEELVQRRLARAQERVTDTREASTRRDPELESMALNIRDRARALGRL
jgi:flagellar biogenesis protein FliO